MSASKRSTWSSNASSNSQQVEIPVWNLMADCWSGYTAHALEYVRAGRPVHYGQGRIHIHWGILWASRPSLFQLEVVTSARGSNDWTPGRFNFASVDSCPPLDELGIVQQQKIVTGLVELYTLQWDLIDESTESGEWVADTHALRDGTSERRECPAHKITRSLAHLFETNKLDRQVLS